MSNNAFQPTSRSARRALEWGVIGTPALLMAAEVAAWSESRCLRLKRSS